MREIRACESDRMSSSGEKPAGQFSHFHHPEPAVSGPVLRLDGSLPFHIGLPEAEKDIKVGILGECSQGKQCKNGNKTEPGIQFLHDSLMRSVA